MKAVAFLGRSGTGKTTLIEKLIPELASRGYRVGAVKHDAHRFEIDHPGKDSYRMTAAGAEIMVIASSEKTALVERNAETPPVEELLSRFFSKMDIVLVEGFRNSGLPRIAVHRKATGDDPPRRPAEADPALLAVASDEPLEPGVPVLDIDDPKAVADFIEARILAR